MKYIKVERADIPSLPVATKISKKPALWSIEGLDGTWATVGPWCLYENMSETYRDISDRCGGLPVQDNTLVAKVAERVYQFVRRS